MPKRTHGRPAKGRRGPRHAPPAPRPSDNGSGPSTIVAEEVVTGVATTAEATTTARRESARTAPSTTRRSGPQHRAPVTTVNYAYLMRDIRSLAVLAPAMVVVLVLAFIFLH